MLNMAEKSREFKLTVSHAPGPNRTGFFVAGLKSLTEVTIDEKAVMAKCSKDCDSFSLYGFCPDSITTAIFLNQLDVVVTWANFDKVQK